MDKSENSIISAEKFLVIQTAFIGDAILASAILEKLHSFFPEAQIDYLIRKGNEQLFEKHPFIKKLLTWDKKKSKLKHQFEIISQIRNEKYDYVINCQRYFSSGLFTVLSGAKYTIGFQKNPLSFLFNKVVIHNFDGIHEVERNQKLIEYFTDQYPAKPRLYPNTTLKIHHSTFITISPSSVWFTKQFPKHKWIEFIDKVPESIEIHLLGAFADKNYNDEIIDLSNRKSGIYNKAGKYTLLKSADLMQSAIMNFVNDSAPMHLCSAVNAPVCAVYCSTIPEFGFGPLSDISHSIEVDEKLDCRPCGIHGHKACPKGHFKCAEDIEIGKLISILKL